MKTKLTPNHYPKQHTTISPYYTSQKSQKIILICKEPHLCKTIQLFFREKVLKHVETFQKTKFWKEIENKGINTFLIESSILTKEGDSEICKIKKCHPNANILVLCQQQDQEKAFQWIQQGIDDIFTLPLIDPRLLKKHIHDLNDKKKYQQFSLENVCDIRSLKEELLFLKHNQESLEQESNRKSHFIKNLSLNLQLPFSKVIQFADIGLQRMGQKELQLAGDYLSEIKWITEELVLYLKDLQELSLLTAGESEFTLEEVDLLHLVKRYKNDFHSIAKNHKISITVLSEIRHAWVLADYTKLSKVMTILMRNALRYAPEKGLVEISLTSKKGKIHLSIFDNGPGIPRKKQKRLFNMLETSNFPDGKGFTGFGLSICNELMRGQNGDITIESSPQTTGTRFLLRMPLARTLLD